MRNDDYNTTSRADEASCVTSPSSRDWTPGRWGIYALIVATSAAVGSVSWWLLPPYLLLMGWLLFAPSGDTRPIVPEVDATRVAIANDGTGNESPTPNEFPRQATENDPPGDSESSQPSATATKTKKTRTKGKGRRRSKTNLPPDPPAASWVRIGPGKYVRVEGESGRTNAEVPGSSNGEVVASPDEQVDDNVPTSQTPPDREPPPSQDLSSRLDQNSPDELPDQDELQETIPTEAHANIEGYSLANSASSDVAGEVPSPEGGIEELCGFPSEFTTISVPVESDALIEKADPVLVVAEPAYPEITDPRKVPLNHDVWIESHDCLEDATSIAAGSSAQGAVPEKVIADPGERILGNEDDVEPTTEQENALDFAAESEQTGSKTSADIPVGHHESREGLEEGHSASSDGSPGPEIETADSDRPVASVPATTTKRQWDQLGRTARVFRGRERSCLGNSLRSRLSRRSRVRERQPASRCRRHRGDQSRPSRFQDPRAPPASVQDYLGRALPPNFGGEGVRS